jgi:hypothetical protein
MKSVLFLLSFSTIAFFACTKKTTNVTTPPITSSPGTFTWTENGGSTITADSAYWTTYNGGTGIRAYKGAGLTNFFEINWSGNINTSIGAKTLNTTGDFAFVQGIVYNINPTVQTLNITAFSADKLSGNATVAVTGGSINTLVISFTALSKK